MIGSFYAVAPTATTVTVLSRNLVLARLFSLYIYRCVFGNNGTQSVAGAQ